MADHLLPEKVRVLNNETRYPVSFQDNNSAPASPEVADQMFIQSLGLTKTAQISRAVLTRGRAGANQKLSVTAATAAQITVAGTIPNNSIIRFRFFLETTKRQASLERPEYEFGRIITFNVNANTGDTAGIILAKLYNSMTVELNSRNRELLIGSGSATAGTFNGLKATTLTVLEFEALERGTFIKQIEVEGADGLPSSVVTVFAPVTSQEFVEPIGLGFDLEFTQKLQNNNNQSYWFDSADLFDESALYTEISWDIVVSRPSPYSPNLSNLVRHVVFLKESSCDNVITQLADFFEQFSGAQYNATVGGTYTFGVTAGQFITNA